MKIPTPKARALLAKLIALSERGGTAGEADAALNKLKRLRARYDFSAPEQMATSDLFKGNFQYSRDARPICTITDNDVASNVKWAIETSCKIPCLFRGTQLLAEASATSAAQLETIATTISQGFTGLWDKFKATPGVHPADRGCFMLGLYEGMMLETRQPGQPLPSRAWDYAPRKAKKRAVNHAPGLSAHPYTVAVGLGKQIRFSVPLEKITSQLDAAIAGQLAQPQATT